MECQTTLSNLERFKPLTDQQRKVLFLLDRGLTQTYIAPRLHISRPRVNQIVKKLECELGLIKRVQNNPKRDGVRSYSYFYELTQHAKSLLKGDLELEQLTPWRVHNHRMKFHIVQQSGTPCNDKRCGFQKSWKIRGQQPSKYWWHNDLNMPSCTLDIFSKTVVIYTDKGQQINAKTKEQAEEIGWIAIRKAMEWFVAKQAEFGIHFVLEAVGEKVGRLHLGMAITLGGPLDSETNIPGTWRDESDGPEFETWEDHPLATPLEKGVMMAAKIPDALAQFNEKLNPINDNVLQVQAMLQGSITQQQMLENVTKLVSGLLVEVQAMRLENQELKKRLGV